MTARNAPVALLCILAATAVSVRSALLYLTVVPLLFLFCSFLLPALHRCHFHGNSGTLLLFGSGLGGALYAVLTAFLHGADTTLVSLPIFLTVCVLCAVAAETGTPLSARLWAAPPAILLIGAIRELLGNGTLCGITLLPAGISPDFATAGNTLGVGGLLIAGLILWIFGLNLPISPSKGHSSFLALQSGLFAAFLWLLRASLDRFFPSLPLLWQWWVCLLPLGAFVALIPKLSLSRSPVWQATLAVLPLFVRAPTDRAWLWMPLLFGGGVAVAVLVITAVLARCHRVPLSRRFAGAPAALTVAACSLYALSAFPS